MVDFRPVGYVIGILLTLLGVAMLVPFLVDVAEDRGEWPVFVQSALVTGLFGVLLALACSNGVKEGLTIQQTFLLTTGVWLALPLFGALPFMFGATEARYVDAFFEAMSGLTTSIKYCISPGSLMPYSRTIKSTSRGAPSIAKGNPISELYDLGAA